MDDIHDLNPLEKPMHVNAYLMFKGNCEEAFRTYAQITGGKIEMMLPHRGSPAEAETPPEWQDKILHACLKIGDTTIMASDAPPGRQYNERGGFCMSLGVGNRAEAERVFAALADGGKITMPITPTFFAAAFGMLIDRFGVPWMVVCEKEG
jgi:PhnB protein